MNWRARTLCFLVPALLASVACSSGDENPNENDPLRDSLIVRCDMPGDHVCREYNRGVAGEASAFVDLGEARAACTQGWPGDPAVAGTFGEGHCVPDDALGRCVTQTHTLPILATVDYYYPGFATTDTLEDPESLLKELCARVESNAAAAGQEVTSIYQSPPFP
ncbi:MAG: hypothetical protein QM756_13655 [Polyangiaceae bacterium]